MDFFANFAQLDDTANLFRSMAGEYSDAMNGLRGAMNLLQNGGFIGECGDHFGSYIERDLRLINEFMELMSKASQTTREVIEEIQDVADQLKSIMPG